MLLFDVDIFILFTSLFKSLLFGECEPTIEFIFISFKRLCSSFISILFISFKVSLLSFIKINSFEFAFVKFWENWAKY
jgi:hypothetical protein